MPQLTQGVRAGARLLATKLNSSGWGPGWTADSRSTGDIIGEQDGGDDEQGCPKMLEDKVGVEIKLAR